jgi:hypothetical protein
MSIERLTTTTPRFAVDDRVFSRYTMSCGRIVSIDRTDDPTPHGVTGDMLPGSTWYTVLMDNGDREYLDDANGNWDLARIVPLSVARRYGYKVD